MDARRFASCRPLVVGSETTRFFHLAKQFIYCESGCETFRFLSPIGCWKRNNSLLSPDKTVYSLWVWMRDVSLLVAHWLLEAKQLASFTWQNCLFIASVDARRFASCRTLVVGSETTRFFHLTKLFIYCECGCETFRFLSPIGCRKRNNSLLSPDKTVYLLRVWMRDVSLFVAYWLLEAKQLASFTRQNCLFIASVDARRFASCRPLVVGSETTRFFHLTKLFIYCECGCETFRFLSPIGCWKRNNSLLSPDKTVYLLWVWMRDVSLLSP